LRAAAVLVLALLIVAPAGCKRSYSVGDAVLVAWEGKDYPAHIIQAEGPAKFKIHYDGYDNVWDETVTRDRIKGFVEGTPPQPDPPAKVRDKALTAAQHNIYKISDHVRVEWHGQIYPATVKAIVGQERYLVGYDGYGPEWNEIVGPPRIQPK
jgi:RNA binding activity-knot of a chromodomain